MAMFVEVEQIGVGKIFINLDSVEKIIPAVNGQGSVLHFNSSYIPVKESPKDFSAFVMQVVTESMVSNKKANLNQKPSNTE